MVAEFEEEDPLESLMKHVKDKESKEGQPGDEDDFEYTVLWTTTPDCSLNTSDGSMWGSHDSVVV